MGLFDRVLPANIRFYFVSYKSGVVDGFADKIRATYPLGHAALENMKLTLCLLMWSWSVIAGRGLSVASCKPGRCRGQGRLRASPKC